MKDKKKLKFKHFYFHPITVVIGLTILVMVLSGILSAVEMQATYSKVNAVTGELETTLVAVENLFNYDGMKYLISNAARNFISFAPLSMILLGLIGISVASATGFLNTFIKRVLMKLDSKVITFIILLVATTSSLINEIGYVILIPLSAIIFLSHKRNPILGIVTAFSGVAFGYGVTCFVGSMEVATIPYTTLAARLIDVNAHIALTSNLFIIIAFDILLSLIGTIIIEKITINKVGKYIFHNDLNKTIEIELIDVQLTEQELIIKERKEKKGLKYALISGIVFIILFIYMVIPGLPLSGMLLDMQETTYLNQVFGVNSYFQDGFGYMISLLFIVTGIAYGLGAKTVKNDKDVIENTATCLGEVGSVVMFIFVFAQFISIFKKTNIGTIIAAWGANLIGGLSFTGIPLIILSIIVIAFCNIFLTGTSKWMILSPVIVPALMQANISPQFAQFLYRAGDSMTNGITPILAYFSIYIAYLNIYNKDKKRPIGIMKAISYVSTYALIIGLAWIVLILAWYLLNIPIGPNVYPTI